MFNKKNISIFLIFISLLTTTLVCLILFAYLYLVPFFAKNNKVLSYISDFVYKNYNLELVVVNSKLHTSLKPFVIFGVDELSLKDKGKTIVNLNDFCVKVSFSDIFNKKIKLDYINATNLVFRVNELIDVFSKQEPSQSATPFFVVDFLNSDINLKNLELSFKQNKAVLDLKAKDIYFKNVDNKKLAFFDLKADVAKNSKNYFVFKMKSQGEVEFLQNEILINGLNITLNNSLLKINSKINEKNILINAKSSKFNLKDVFLIVQSDFIIPDGESLLLPLEKPEGSVAFDVDLNNQDISGVININNTKANIKDLSSLPIKIQDGNIKISKDKIQFINLNGFYGKNKANKVLIEGDIKDYYKTMDSYITVDTVITNEFFKNYLSGLINNTSLYISKPQKTRIIYTSKNNIMDIVWLAKISKGVNFGVSDFPSKIINFDRAVKGEFHIENNDLEIKNINYYISQDIKKGVKIQPVLVLDGKMTLDGKIDNIGFRFDREIPCEFLNIFTKDKVFSKGTIKGNLHLGFKDNIPYLLSDLEINKTILPSQRLFIKYAKLNSDDDTINVQANGGFKKKVKFDFSAKLKNRLEAPFIVKDLKLEVDKIDIEKLLLSLNNQENNKEIEIQNINSEDDIEDDDYMFDTKLIRIEKCLFSLKEGNYKELKFSNINANLTLDEKGILDLYSNKFNIADGISTLKIKSDLKNLKHYLRLGVKEVDSDLMAKVFLNLEKEISGKASGLIEITTDENLKLNGGIKFEVKDGTIGKIGLVEYLMKVASLFRNPIAMINPATVMDIIAIPEGKFDRIYGEIDFKDNVASRIDIKSYSSSLSALIRGRFDLERHDASMRIYTRFSESKKSPFGFVRNFSLNALANKIQMNTRNDANYYSSELVDLPQIDVEDSKTQVFLTTVEGDIENNNFLSGLKKIK